MNLSSDFAVGLDIDDDASSKEAAELCEKSFLSRLASWKGDGNYRPTTYQDLADLPIILIVVEKGKMGITSELQKVEIVQASLKSQEISTDIFWPF